MHYLNLSPHILVILLANQLLLWDGFAGVINAARFLSAEEGDPELPLPKFLADGVETLERRGSVGEDPRRFLGVELRKESWFLDF